MVNDRNLTRVYSCLKTNRQIPISFLSLTSYLLPKLYPLSPLSSQFYQQSVLQHRRQ